MSDPVIPGLAWGVACRPQVVRAGRFPLDDRGFRHGYLSPTHALHVYGYEADFDREGTRLHLVPGDCTLSPSGMTTRYHLERAGHHWCVHFRPEQPRGRAVDLPLHLSLGRRRQAFSDAVMRIATLLADGRGDLARDLASVVLQDLLLQLALLAGDVPRTTRGSGAAEAAAAILDQDLLRPPSVVSLARRLRISQTHLARAFRRRFGMTLARYVLGRRIDEARHLLQVTDLPVGRIAERLGFSDVQHFNKQFRRVAGRAPSLYRRDLG